MSYERKMKKRSLAPLNGRVASKREAHIITRLFLGTSGNLVLDGSGNVGTASLGGFDTAGSGAFELRPANLGWIVDLASHFAYWKLHRASLVYTPMFQSVSGATAYNQGTVAIGFQDDPNVPSSVTGPNVLELRCSGEFSEQRRFKLDYVPDRKSLQAGWLYCDATTTSTTSAQQRLTSAGVLVAKSTAASGLSGSVGRLELIVEISLRGAVGYHTITASPGRAGVTESKQSEVEDIELIDLPKGGSVRSSTSASATVPATPIRVQTGVSTPVLRRFA